MGRFTIQPLTPERWFDLEALFGDRGASSGCWCMWWRQSAADFERLAGQANRRALLRIVEHGPPPGLLAYHDGKPVGWIAVGHRDQYPRLARSPKLKPIDDQPVWSITCFYIDRKWRRAGVARELLEAAVRHARNNGARIVEGYPIDTSGRAHPNAVVFTGVLELFEEAGFTEAARRGGRPIVRKKFNAANPRSARR